MNKPMLPINPSLIFTTLIINTLLFWACPGILAKRNIGEGKGITGFQIKPVCRTATLHTYLLKAKRKYKTSRFGLFLAFLLEILCLSGRQAAYAGMTARGKGCGSSVGQDTSYVYRSEVQVLNYLSVIDERKGLMKMRAGGWLCAGQLIFILIFWFLFYQEKRNGKRRRSPANEQTPGQVFGDQKSKSRFCSLSRSGGRFGIVRAEPPKRMGLPYFRVQGSSRTGRFGMTPWFYNFIKTDNYALIS